MLTEVLSVKRGKYRAAFGGVELGELASPPEIRADYDTGTIPVFGGTGYSRNIEGGKELYARINLKTKSVIQALDFLNDLPSDPLALLLYNPDQKPEFRLEFPAVHLLPVWNFEPSFSGDHLISINFYAESDINGKLFYFSGT